ncbi:SDR family NAD(P)-dependent oxidoreductase [Sphingobium cloacae]|uniref:Cyclopentanol dehydrogenase n=1 Tax=Sphingobium cloacae TaxID=120107 RepID=A0A1E1EXY6_9SPHN|nr:SDR family oxidoreductase [Sphingobium cloacae]BAV63062.1 cyclopentanol dehydrogenase [Sphingobium cloacae]
MLGENFLAGKVAVITGAAQGLGAACSKVLAEAGAQVIATDVNEDLGKRLTAEVSRSGYYAKYCRHDVSNEDEWTILLKDIDASFGKVDILVNNAAIMEFEPLETMESAFFDRVISINLRGTFLGCKMILPLMKRAGGGSIINISSNAGVVANMEGQAAYAASKGGIRLLTKAVAHDYVRFNIRANSVHPGTMSTPRAAAVLEDPSLRSWAIGRTLMARPGEPSEVANVVAFLASDYSSYMTGSEVMVDGGYLAC